MGTKPRMNLFGISEFEKVQAKIVSKLSENNVLGTIHVTTFCEGAIRGTACVGCLVPITNTVNNLAIFLNGKNHF